MTDRPVPRASTSFLAVGLSLQLTDLADEAQAQYGTSLLGWKQGAWLICEWPFHLGRPIACVAGTALLLRYLYQGKLIGYRTEVLSTHLEPFPFLLVSFPQSLDEVPLRKHGRMLAHEPILLRQGNDGRSPGLATSSAPIGGVLTDVSASGCAVLVQAPGNRLPPGTIIRVEFELVGTGRVANLAALVRNVSPHGPDLQLGLEFRFDGQETIEYRGWGGSVRNALETFMLQRRVHEST